MSKEDYLTPEQAAARAEMLRHLAQRIHRLPKKLAKHLIHLGRQDYPDWVWKDPSNSRAKPERIRRHSKIWQECLKTERQLQHFSGKGR